MKGLMMAQLKAGIFSCYVVIYIKNKICLIDCRIYS